MQEYVARFSEGRAGRDFFFPKLLRGGLLWGQLPKDRMTNETHNTLVREMVQTMHWASPDKVAPHMQEGDGGGWRGGGEGG
jgi:hypothetical protein